jgi:hypothetical protein
MTYKPTYRAEKRVSVGHEYLILCSAEVFLMQLSFCKRNGQARTQKGGLPGCKAPSNQNLKDTDFVKTAIYFILRDLPAAKTSD